MANFEEAIKKGIKDAFCQAASNASNLYEFFKELLPLAPRFPNVADFWRQLVCDQPPTPPPGPGFTGGQCSTCYNVTIQFTVSGSNISQYNGTYTQNYQKYGPIGGVSYRKEGSGNSQRAFLTITSKGNCTTPPGTTTVTEDGTPFSIGATGNVQINTVTIARVDGQADNCGNLPPVYPPYTPGGNIVNAPVTYVDNNNNNVTIPVGFAFGYAKIDVNANIKIPVTVNLDPNFNFNAEFNFSTGDINFNIGGTPADRGPATGDPRPGNQPDDFDTPSVPTVPPNAPPNPDPTPKPKPEQRQVLVGAIVTSQLTSLGRLTEVKQDGGNPNIYAPNLGYINFYYRFASGAAGWGADLPVKNVQQFIPCEFDGGAVSVRGTPKQNVIWSITPVYLTRNVGDQIPA